METTPFARRLRELREKAALTQAALAERAGMHMQSITKLERGERLPAWVTIQALAKALGVGIDAFDDVPEQAEKPRRPGRPRKPAKPAEPAPVPKKTRRKK